MNKIKKQLPKEQSVTTRRAFLKGAASAGGAAALVASTGSAAHETKGQPKRRQAQVTVSLAISRTITRRPSCKAVRLS